MSQSPLDAPDPSLPRSPFRESSPDFDASRPAPTTSSHRSKGIVLLVDEDAASYHLMVRLLSENNFEVIWAQSGNDGIRLAESQSPDVILLDMHLPDIDSLSVCRNLRLRSSTWSIPVILLTACELEETDIARGLELGANDCVSKPYKTLELLGRIRVLIRMKRMEDKLRSLYVERTRQLESSNIELQQIRAQLILKNQMSKLGMMVAVAAHEIRSPAASISNNLELTGALLSDFIETFARRKTLLPDPTPNDITTFHEVLQRVARTNLSEAPLDVIARRKEARGIRERLIEYVPDGLPERVTDQMAKFHVGRHLKLAGPLLNRYGASWLEPVFHLGELLIKFKNMTISIDRINSIVRAMKSYSRIDRPELQEVTIHEGLEDTLTIMNYVFQGHMEVTTQYAPNLPRIQGYPGELNQVWTNLLQNAFDAREGGHGRIIVETELEDDRVPGEVVVRFKDDGRGIPREILPHVFDAFFTTKERGEGSGLGLHICKQIVARHRGRIDLEAAAGETVVTVHLPIQNRRSDT